MAEVSKKRKMTSSSSISTNAVRAKTCNKRTYTDVASSGCNTDPIPGVVVSLLDKVRTADNVIDQQLKNGLQELLEKRQNLGRNSFQVASALNFVGTILFQQQDFESALVFFKEELRIEEALNGCEDLSLSVTCNNIGRILQETQRFEEAIQYYERSIKISELVDSCETSEMGESTLMSMRLCSTVWYNLGLIHDQLRSKSEAIKAFKMSLRFRRVLMGTAHSDVACLLFNIGVLQMEEKMLQEATVSITEFLKLQRSVTITKLNDEKIIKVLQQLVSLHRNNGNMRNSMLLLREIIRIYHNSTEMEVAHKRLSIGTTLREIAELHHVQGEMRMALTAAQKSVRVLKPSSGFVVPDYFCSELVSSLLLLGSLMLECSESMGARRIFYAAINTIDATVGSSNACSSQLDHIREISFMLATSHCAPVA